MSANCFSVIAFKNKHSNEYWNNWTIKRASDQQSVLVCCLKCRMYKFLLIACFLGLSAADCQYKENYCDPSLCPPGVEHIACNNSGQFEDSCPADRKLIHLTTAEIESMVNIHNTLRNKIASGDEVGFLPASRMATMVKTKCYWGLLSNKLLMCNSL